VLLHFGDIVFGLVEGLHLKGIHHDTTGMQLGNHVFKGGRVRLIIRLNHKELAQFFVQGHM